MSETNQVYENFEDAIFRLFMDRVALVEGERLFHENAELKRDPDAAVPEDVQKRCLKAALSRSSRKIVGRTARKAVRIVALAAVIALLLGAAAFATIPSFHARILNVFMKHEDTTVDWEFGGQPPELDEEPGTFSVTVPDGYIMRRRSADSETEYRLYTRGNNQEEEIQISIARINEGTRISTDAEDLDYYEEITVHGKYPGIISVKDGFSGITWVDTEHAIHISISANALSRDELIDLAESVKFEQTQ